MDWSSIGVRTEAIDPPPVIVRDWTAGPRSRLYYHTRVSVAFRDPTRRNGPKKLGASGPHDEVLFALRAAYLYMEGSEDLPEAPMEEASSCQAATDAPTPTAKATALHHPPTLATDQEME